MEVPSQAVRTLMEVGVVAAGSGLFKQALAIFEGLEAVRPDSEGPMVGLALIHMNSRAYDDAVKLLREGAITKNPNSLEAKMLLGTALKLAGRNSECDSVIKELAASDDEKAKAYAQALAAR